jgi:uncharacterized protein (TIGR00369 family)
MGHLAKGKLAAVPADKPRVPPNCDIFLGLTCVDKREPGVTVWSMTPSAPMADSSGFVQGGFVAALIDSAMASATITELKGRRAYTANTDLTINFVRVARVDETLTCTARVLRGEEGVSFTAAEVSNPSGQLVATASSTYVVSGRG